MYVIDVLAEPEERGPATSREWTDESEYRLTIPARYVIEKEGIVRPM